MIMDKLSRAAQSKGPVCVGLDTRYDYLPAYIKDSSKSLCDRLFEFNKAIIDATHDVSKYRLPAMKRSVLRDSPHLPKPCSTQGQSNL